MAEGADAKRGGLLEDVRWRLVGPFRAGRVVAVAMEKVRSWDAATGAERDAFERDTASASDRLAVSPDGRWLAVTQDHMAQVNDLVPPGP